jgi:hypothetical protein
MFLFVPPPLPTCRSEHAEAELGDEEATPDAGKPEGARSAQCRPGIGCAEKVIFRDTTA